MASDSLLAVRELYILLFNSFGHITDWSFDLVNKDKNGLQTTNLKYFEKFKRFKLTWGYCHS